MHTTIHRHVTQVCAALLCALATVTICGQALARPNIDGAWKLSKQQALLTPANGEPIPFTAEGKKIYDQNKASAQQGKYGFDEVMDRCASPGMPRIMLSPNQFKIFDRPGMVMFKFEWNRMYRQVDMRDDATIENSKPLPRRAGAGFPGAPDDPFTSTEALIGTQMGHSRGRWEGDVLVVETNEFADYKLIDGLIQTSGDLKLSERFRLKNKNTLEHRITITDPVTFTKPWDAVLTYSRLADEEMKEDVCLERKHAGESPWPKPL